MGLANIGFYFVVLTSAATLHASGQTDVQTAAQAAEALRPLAGQAASLVFALGIIGTGLLAVPVLAGAAAYATAELFDWPEGLANRFRQAPQFYAVIALATLLGGALSVVGVSEIWALYVAAIVNGVIAPPLLVVIMLIARDRRVLGDHIASRRPGRPRVGHDDRDGGGRAGALRDPRVIDLGASIRRRPGGLARRPRRRRGGGS